MKTIEDKLQAAHELGRISGAAECFADEDVRNTVCGAARALFDGLLTEAAEEERHPRDTVKGSLWNIWRGTSFSRITKSPEVLARNLVENVYECPRGGCPDRHDPSKEDCVRCLTDWLNEEATPDD